MLTSLLNRDFKKIVLDRAVKFSDDGNASLITEPEALKTHCDDTFTLQFKARQHLFDTDTDTWAQWKEEYTPQSHINPEIYSKLLTEPTLSEWDDTVKDCNDKSAPGISGIGFKMLKHLPLQTELCYLLDRNSPRAMKMEPDVSDTQAEGLELQR